MLIFVPKMYYLNLDRKEPIVNYFYKELQIKSYKKFLNVRQKNKMFVCF